jgi:hypothetical protein
MNNFPKELSVAPKQSQYQVPEPLADKLRENYLPTQFDALSVGTPTGQFAIIPLDESSEDNAHELVRRWNNFSKLEEDLKKEKAIVDHYAEGGYSKAVQRVKERV